MSSQTYIAGDWGTSHLRLFLCDGAQVLERREGPGVAALSMTAPAGFSDVLRELCAGWTRKHGALAVWLSGMIGSRNGWREAPYVPCPADTKSLSASMLRFDADGCAITIVPGLCCVNPRGAPDVLRGEETQIFGALADYPGLEQGRHILVLPGTHAKWALIENGRVLQFQTSMSGELYALLQAHSTLATVPPSTNADVEATVVRRDSFEQGLERARDFLAAPLHHLMFEARSRQLVGELTHVDAMGFLSGLIIGQDVLGALRLFDGMPASGHRVTIIGASDLTGLYRTALSSQGIDTFVIDASKATVSGLKAYAQLA